MILWSVGSFKARTVYLPGISYRKLKVFPSDECELLQAESRRWNSPCHLLFHVSRIVWKTPGPAGSLGRSGGQWGHSFGLWIFQVWWDWVKHQSFYSFFLLPLVDLGGERQFLRPWRCLLRLAEEICGFSCRSFERSWGFTATYPVQPFWKFKLLCHSVNGG